MTRKATSSIVIMLLLVAVLATGALAARNSEIGRDKLQAYGFAKSELSQNSVAATKNAPGNALGVFSADGDSPGYITGRTCQDHVNWFSPFYTVGWRHSPRIHFGIGAQPFGGEDETVSAKWTEYTMFDATTPPQGVWRSPVMLQTDPFNYNGAMHQVDVDETGHAIISCHVDRPSNEEFVTNSEVYWDVAGPGAYGTFVGDTMPQSISMNAEAGISYPLMVHQEFNGVYTTHLIAMESIAPNGWVTYYRRVGANPTLGNWVTTPISGDLSWDAIYALACSQGDGPEGNKVAIAWLKNVGAGPGEDEDVTIALVESTDGGATWPNLSTPTHLVDVVSEPDHTDWLPWAEVHALYDSEGYLHISFNAGANIDGASQGIDPARLYHWTNRVAGDAGGGTLSLVHIADFQGLSPMCGRTGNNRTNASNAHLSECNGRLYMIWQQFGDPDVGDSLDCPTDGDFNGGYNADIYMSVSLGLDGSLWDQGRNLTNSKSPECDSSVANNCNHDNYASATRYGMNVADMGTTYWAAVPEAFAVRDYLDATYPVDSWYIDVHYINDLYPDVAPWMDGDAIWTYNPMKWFRLPCVAPVIQPDISSSQDDYLTPSDWVKLGTEVTIEDVTIDNIGNDLLTINSISANVTTGQASWISITDVPTTVAAGSASYFNVVINPGGMVTSPEALVADIVISSDDPDEATITSFGINTVIADTVVAVVYDTVSTAWPVSLVVANQGGAGRSGSNNAGGANLDFEAAGIECTAADETVTTENIYLYDLCPIIMYDGTGDDGTYSWGPFWTPDRADTHNFWAVSDGDTAEKTTGSGYEQYQTNTFVTSDSVLGCTKTWIAPADSVAWMIEKWEVYSYQGGSVSGARMAEWIDWDAPTGLTGNTGNFVTGAGSVDYLYQQGAVDIAADPVACLDQDRRFGASGLLGYYFTSEREADPEINHTGLYGGFVHQDEDLFESGADQFIVDSVWAWMNRNIMSANNSADEDQQILLSFGEFDIIPDDTLCIWTLHVSIYDGEAADLQTEVDEAEAWYFDHFVKAGCCGSYSDGTWPTGYTGNTNCSDDGKRTLSDITKLIDNVYISKEPLCCYASGNTNGSWDDGECKITLSDITKLIDAVYISKELTEACNSGCER